MSDAEFAVVDRDCRVIFSVWNNLEDAKNAARDTCSDYFPNIAIFKLMWIGEMCQQTVVEWHTES